MKNAWIRSLIFPMAAVLHLDVRAAESATYFPLTVGSYWTYQSTISEDAEPHYCRTEQFESSGGAYDRGANVRFCDFVLNIVEGEVVLRAGDFVHHPPRHVHDFMAYSEDIEIFELASPAHHHAIDV